MCLITSQDYEGDKELPQSTLQELLFGNLFFFLFVQLHSSRRMVQATVFSPEHLKASISSFNFLWPPLAKIKPALAV